MLIAFFSRYASAHSLTGGDLLLLSRLGRKMAAKVGAELPSIPTAAQRAAVVTEALQSSARAVSEVIELCT